VTMVMMCTLLALSLSSECAFSFGRTPELNAASHGHCESRLDWRIRLPVGPDVNGYASSSSLL
ncbi:hypothetical protein AB7533_27305, partial [Providencia rettgeri]